MNLDFDAEYRAKRAPSGDVQSLINKTANDKAITGAELLDILHGFGLIPKPTPSKPAAVKK
jgi:hypothetical protein